MKEIALTGKCSHLRMIVDDDMHEELSSMCWHGIAANSKSGISGGVYAVHSYREDGKIKHTWAHRLVAGTPEVMLTDHINCNMLDNRRENLRSCTCAENLKNCKKLRGRSKTKYRGICKSSTNSYMARFKYKGNNIYCGNYPSQEAAALAWDKKAEELMPGFCVLNFPEKLDNQSEHVNVQRQG